MYSKIQHIKVFSCNCHDCNYLANSEMNLKDFNSNNSEIVKRRDVEKEEILAIRNRFPNKVPVIVKRYPRETNLPHLDKSKYLVPQEITMSQFQTIIRNRMQLQPNQALYLLINERSMLSLSLTLAEIYKEYALPDGYLYITYASQEVFGEYRKLKTKTDLTD